MGSLFAPMHLLVLFLLLLFFFGRGRISEILEEFGRGIKSFKKGLEEEDPLKEQKKQKMDEHPGA